MDISNLIFLATGAAEAVSEHGQESAGFVGTLGLNWKLFAAQLVNFAIVVLILWKWAFRPISRALEERRQKVENSVRQAEEIEVRMKEFMKNREEQMAKARRIAESILKKAESQAEANKSEVIKSAQIQAEKILVEAKARLGVEREKMFLEIREELANLTVMATEKILRAKLDEDKDKKLVQEVLKKI